jgi:hypothetical protein
MLCINHFVVPRAFSFSVTSSPEIDTAAVCDVIDWDNLSVFLIAEQCSAASSWVEIRRHDMGDSTSIGLMPRITAQ